MQKKIGNDIFFDVKLQRKSIAFIQTLNDRSTFCSFDIVKVLLKCLLTPCYRHVLTMFDGHLYHYIGEFGLTSFSGALKGLIFINLTT